MTQARTKELLELLIDEMVFREGVEDAIFELTKMGFTKTDLLALEFDEDSIKEYGY